MRQIVITFFLIASAAVVARSQTNDFKVSEIYPIERSHSYIGFSVKYMGYAMVRGRFADFNGSFRFVENDPSKTSVTLSIAASSLDTESEFRDKDLKSPNWFGAEAFPTILFESQKAEVSGHNLSIIGSLTLHGVTKTVKIPITESSGIMKDIRGDAQVIFSGELKLNRSDYGVEGKNWSAIKEGMTAVADEVKIEFTILGKQLKENNFKNRVMNPNSPPGKIYAATKTDGPAGGIKMFDTIKSGGGIEMNENALNTVGYMLLIEGKTNDAVAIFRKNVELFPQSAAVYDSYGEALATAGNWAEAKKNYVIALEKDPTNMNAKEVLKHIP